LREIPDRALGTVVTATAQGGGAGMVVEILVGPLPDIAGHIHDAEWTGSEGMGVDGRRASEIAAQVALGDGLVIPVVAPRIQPAIGALRGVLPFPFMREALAGPLRIGAGIFERDPGDGAI